MVSFFTYPYITFDLSLIPDSWSLEPCPLIRHRAVRAKHRRTGANGALSISDARS